MGREPGELIKSGVHGEDYYQEMWTTILAGKVWHREIVNRNKALAVSPLKASQTMGGALAILQADRAGQGKPLYSQNHAVRQRLSVRDMRCPMCGEPTTAADRWTQVAHPVAAGRLRAAGRGDRLPASHPATHRPGPKRASTKAQTAKVVAEPEAVEAPKATKAEKPAKAALTPIFLPLRSSSVL